MTRINAFGETAKTRDCVAWGKNSPFEKSGALLFAALLIVCSLAVGCNSDKPKPVSSNNQIPATQDPTPNTMISSSQPAPTAQAAKPAVKKVVKKRPATVTYVDQTYGVSFEYPRRYGLETGNAATELVASSPLPMNFVAPGGVALAAVDVPESAFANTDLSGAFFDVSMNKTLTGEQCGEFAVPQMKSTTASASSTQATSPAGTAGGSAEVGSTTSGPAQEATSHAVPASTPADTTMGPASSATTTTATSPTSKLMLGDLELQSAEAIAGDGDRQTDTKYFHLFQNGGCFEFALNVTTVAHDTEGGMKHVDRDKVFNRLESILATVKVNPIAAPDATASTPAAPASPAPETPAQ